MLEKVSDQSLHSKNESVQIAEMDRKRLLNQEIRKIGRKTLSIDRKIIGLKNALKLFPTQVKFAFLSLPFLKHPEEEF